METTSERSSSAVTKGGLCQITRVCQIRRRDGCYMITCQLSILTDAAVLRTRRRFADDAVLDGTIIHSDPGMMPATCRKRVLLLLCQWCLSCVSRHSNEWAYIQQFLRNNEKLCCLIFMILKKCLPLLFDWRKASSCSSVPAPRSLRITFISSRCYS